MASKANYPISGDGLVGKTKKGWSSCVQVWQSHAVRPASSLPFATPMPLVDPHQRCHVVSALRPLQLSSIPRDKSLDASEMGSGLTPMHTDPIPDCFNPPPQSVSGGGREGKKIPTIHPNAWKRSSIDLAAEECDGHHIETATQIMPH